MRLALSFARALLILCFAAALSGAEEWVLGGEEGIAWGSVAQRQPQIDDESSPGAIQIKGFTPDENIITTLDWSYGKPVDLISEGTASLWDNTAFRDAISINIVDGIDTTSTGDLFKRAGIDQDGRVFFFDLGSRVPADSLRLYPRQEGGSASGRPYSEDFLRKLTLQVNDGIAYVNKQPLFQLLRDVPVNPNSVFTMKFPAQFIRFVRLRVGSRSAFEIAEFELYGNGFVPRALYESKVINLGGDSNYGAIFWVQRTLELRDDELVEIDAGEAQTSASIRLKTGLDDSPLIHFQKLIDPETREVSQVVVSEGDYNSLPTAEKGDIEQDTENWSPWSLPLASGQKVPLPSPRPYFMLQIVMESESVQQTVRIDSLVIEHSVPPASAVWGEISLADQPNPPPQIGIVDKDDAVVLSSIDGGEQVLFAYDVRADVERTQTGFDALRIDTPTPGRFVDLLMGTPLTSVAPDSVVENANSIEVFFTSNKINFANNAPLRILFEGSVVVFGTIFTGTVWDTQSELLSQPVLEGDANFNVSTNALRMALTPESVGQILRKVEIIPPVFTPNGDGINDRLGLKYTLIQISEPTGVEVTIFDLGGGIVRRLVQKEQIGGIYSEFWDGKNDSGEIVPPGTYIFRIKVASDIGSFEKVGAIGLVY